MRTLDKFWQSLETIRGGATLPAEWTRLMGEEYALTAGFFRSTGELAPWFPHRDPDYCYYRVVTHGPDEHVGVCDETGDRIELATADLIIHALDRRALQQAIAAALGLTEEDAPLENLPWTRLLGAYLPAVGHRFPVYLTICRSPEEFREQAQYLVITHEVPFLLLAPTRRFCRPAVETVLACRKAHFLPLCEALVWTESQTLSATPAARAVLDGFCRDALPPDARAETEIQRNRFRQQGDVRIVRFQQREVCLKNTKGMVYLAQLLASPGRSIHAAALVAAAGSRSGAVVLGSAGADLDAEAMNIYRRHAEELSADLADARACNDLGRQESLQAEIDHLAHEVTAAVGLGGRRREKTDADRFRRSVTMAIARAIKGIEAVHPELGRHLLGAIRSGRFYCYAPETSVEWDV